VVTPSGNIFFAGDTGWGDGGWVREAAANGPFRLAIIPIGAYEPRDFMRTHHINPDEAVAIFQALNPARALGVHWGTFQLTFEGIDDPPRRLAALRRARNIAADQFVATQAGQAFDVPPLTLPR
jgi:L-ascorbate metabolism protein UlaG (beta-lactamase superfamily)